MSVETIATVVKMLETLPDATQNRVVEYLQNYLADLQDEQRWDEAFASSENTLIAQARLAKQQIAEGLARPLQLDDL